jgi:iron complex transport system substrate-binding protein
VLLFAPCGYDLARAAREARDVLATDAWQWATDRSSWAIDANALASRPGPRVVAGVETIAAILHSALFGAPARDRAVPL